MHKLNIALLSWRNEVKQTLEAEGITYFNCKFEIHSSQEFPEFKVYFSLPSGSPYSSMRSGEIVGADPNEVIAELIHRVQFQRQQTALALPSPKE